MTANIYLRAQEVMTADNERLFVDYEFVTWWNGTAAAIEQFADIRSEVQSESAGEAIGLVDQTRWDTQLHEAHVVSEVQSESAGEAIGVVDQTRWDTQLHEAHVVGEHSLQLTQRCNASAHLTCEQFADTHSGVQSRSAGEAKATAGILQARGGSAVSACSAPWRLPF